MFAASNLPELDWAAVELSKWIQPGDELPPEFAAYLAGREPEQIATPTS
jgi:hypothetical protein